MPICGIYKITNQINGKCYIGQSVDIEKRWHQHKRRSLVLGSTEYDSYFHRAIRKYGLENFSFEVLEECLKEELNEKETFYVSRYSSNQVESGYNLTAGGDSVSQKSKKLSDEELQNVISDLKNTTLSQAEIGQKYNIAQTTVSGINRGEFRYQENETYPLRDSNVIRGWNLIKPKVEKEIQSKTKETNIKICPICGKEYKGVAKTCSVECGIARSRKMKVIPKRSALKYLIRNYSFEWIGRQFGVTGNTIKKYCDKANLPRTKTLINSYSDEEWKKI